MENKPLQLLKEIFLVRFQLSLILDTILFIPDRLAYDIWKTKVHGEYTSEAAVLKAEGIGLYFSSYFPLLVFIIVSIFMYILVIRQSDVNFRPSIIVIYILYYIDYLGWNIAIDAVTMASGGSPYILPYIFGLVYSTFLIYIFRRSYKKFKNKA